LNEAAAIGPTLEAARGAAGNDAVELIVSDCNSRDETVAIGRAAGARVVLGGWSRASAMNRGAAAARGEVVLFVHADTVLPEGYAGLVMGALKRPGAVGGAFDFNFGSHPLNHGLNRQWLRMVRIMNRVRFRWTGNYYGDQAIFCRRDVFVALGGFPDVRLLEDVRFCQRMRRAGRAVTISTYVKTSPRRFVTRGVLRQLGCDLRMLAMDGMGLRCEGAMRKYNLLNKTGEYR
jgi:glycosyltransferase involved in cell wall biosynthesis